MSSPLGLTTGGLGSGVPSISGSPKNYKVLENKAVKSLFGTGQFSPFPGSINKSSGSVTGISSATDVHKDVIYDNSITSLIEYCKKYPSMKLDYADFAYLKNVGVYPNNRLIIVRRFAAGVSNDLTEIKVPPLSTLISWVDDQSSFISISYGEEWTDAEASFEDVLNDIGEDTLAGDNSGKKLGTNAAQAFKAIPLKGFMEGIQYEVMSSMGITEAGIGNSPFGDPNQIRTAKRRKVVGRGEEGSGLKAKFSVAVKVEYEQKFINGVDPTLVYLDIIQNALTFGTSDSRFQFNSAFASGTSNIISKLISGDIVAIGVAVADFATKLINVITRKARELVDALINPPKVEDKPDSGTIAGFIIKAFASTIGHVISKYKVRLVGIANALTGSPSTPWHVTIGNPKKPIFSSGDMLCNEVKLELGPVLAFNDLPSTITLEFTLENARPLGAQEIFNRLNTGKGRSYVRFNKSYVEVSDTKFATASTTVEISPTQSVTSVEVTPVVETTNQDDYALGNTNDGPIWFTYNANIKQEPKTGDNTDVKVKNGNLESSKQSSGGTQSASIPGSTE